MPMPQIFLALVKMGYKGQVDLEYEINENNPMPPGMIESFAYTRRVLAGIQALRVHTPLKPQRPESFARFAPQKALTSVFR